MPRAKTTIPLEMKPVRLFQGDFERLQALFPTMGAGPAIRKLVRNHCDRVEETCRPVDIDISDIAVEELMK